MTEIDVTRPCVTREMGWAAKHLGEACDASGELAMRVWLISPPSNAQFFRITNPDGRTTEGRDSTEDIINAPPTETVWIAVIRNCEGGLRHYGCRQQDKKPTDEPLGLLPNSFIGWQRATITDQPEEE